MILTDCVIVNVNTCYGYSITVASIHVMFIGLIIIYAVAYRGEGWGALIRSPPIGVGFKK